jgi:selenide,water dikinase
MSSTDPKTIRLTQTVQKGGCAAKVAAVELRKILSRVRFPPAPPELAIDAGTFDDAAIYRVSPELALVQTLDFFTPIVDTPKLFGRIAAANALSDVYAMGGRPGTAMSILAFPIATLPPEAAVDILQGASDAIAEAGACLVGGHTIDDDTLKFGLSVTGFVHPDRVWSNSGARPGDTLLLTKPLGTGTLTAALKCGDVTEDAIRDGLESMATLNDAAGALGPEHSGAIHAATDITGFGLAGHAYNLARASGVTLEIDSAALPRFERAMALLADGYLTKAHRTNREYAGDACELGPVDPTTRELLFDPQTSGGLLLSVAPERAGSVLEALRRKFPASREIGRVSAAGEKSLRFR